MIEFNMIELILVLIIIAIGSCFILKENRLSKKNMVVNYYFDGHLFQVSGLRDNHKLIMKQLNSPYNTKELTYQYFYDLCCEYKCSVCEFPENYGI